MGKTNTYKILIWDLGYKAGWAKLNKYYSLSEQSSAYAAAIVLCPQYKFGYFAHWQDDWITKIRT
jgi:hypothetical protein